MRNINTKRMILVITVAIIITAVLAESTLVVMAAEISGNGNTVSVTNSSGSTRKWRSELSGTSTENDTSVDVTINSLLLRNITGLNNSDTYPMKVYAGDITATLSATGQNTTKNSGKVPSADKQLQKNKTIKAISNVSYSWDRLCDDYIVEIVGKISTPSTSWKGTSTATIKMTIPAHTHYTINYEGLGKNDKKCIGQTYTITSDKPTKEGYVFAGWSKNKDGSIDYTAGDSYTEDANITLYPLWKVASPSREYKVMFCI